MATVTRVFQSAQYDGTNPQEIVNVANLWQSFGQMYTTETSNSGSVTIIRDDGFTMNVPVNHWIVSDDSGGSPFDSATYETLYATL